MGQMRRSGWLVVLVAGTVLLVACGGALDLDASEVGPADAAGTANPLDREMTQQLQEIGETNVVANLDHEVNEWCVYRAILDDHVPPGSVWDANDPADAAQYDDVMFLVELMAERIAVGPAVAMPEAFASRVCEQCPVLAEPLPAGSPRLPPDSPAVWGPDCGQVGANDPIGELGCAAMLAPEDCEATEACWFRYLGEVGCYDKPDLVPWAEEWCGILRQKIAWEAERESHTTWEARDEWLAANEALFEQTFQRERELNDQYDGFDPAGFHIQQAKCEVCPDIYTDCVP